MSTCGTCDYWVRRSENRLDGVCVLLQKKYGNFNFPVLQTDHRHGCGQHKPKKETK